MKSLLLLQCPTLLSSRTTYQIKGILYRYLYENGSIQHPQYIFRPLSGQKKKADLKLNRQKLLIQCYVVPDIPVKAEVVSEEIVQMKLF
jgi:hypothetical protein